MLLLQPALGTLESKNHPWKGTPDFMGARDQQDSLMPADTVAYPRRGTQGGLSLVGLDLSADLDMDTLVGSAAIAATGPTAPILRQPSSEAMRFAFSTHSPMYGPATTWNHPMACQVEAQPSQVSYYMPQQEPAPVAQHFNIIMTQNPAISVARPSQPTLALPPVSQAWPFTSAPFPSQASLSFKEGTGPSSSAGSASQASGRATQHASRQGPTKRTNKAPAPEARAQKEAAARARNARNQQLHRQRQKDRLKKFDELSVSLKAKLERLTIQNAGLRAQNEALMEAEADTPSPAPGGVEQVWEIGQPGVQHTALHEKLAAVFSCISEGCGRKAVSADDVSQMTAEEIFSFRQQYGNRLRMLLCDGADSPASPLHAELLRLVTLWNESNEYLWQHCPKTVHRFNAFAKRMDERKGINAARNWQTILGQLQLDARQVAALKGIHTRLVDTLLNVTAERLHISNILQGTLPEGDNTWLGSRTFLSLRAGHKKLVASVAREHEAMREAHAAFRQVITLVQQAPLDVLAHPGSLDIIALLHELTSQPRSAQLPGSA